MSDVLLKVEPGDYARLISGRRKAAIVPFVICLALATAIIVAEYRLMLIAFVIFVPGLIGILDAVMVARGAKKLGSSCEVRHEGEWLVLNANARVRVDAISLVRIQPDALTLVEQLAPNRFNGYLLAADEARQEKLIARLASLGRKLKHEKTTIKTLVAFFWSVMANLVLEAVAGVLVLGFVGYTGKGLIDGTGPGWEALACFLGAVACLTIVVLLKRFVLGPAAKMSRD